MGVVTTATAVWVDDPNPIFRQGLATCLREQGFEVAGTTAGLRPEPDLRDSGVLLFDVEAVGLARATALGHRAGVRLIGLVREAREELLYESLTAGLAGVLVRGDLTPERLAGCVRAVAEGHGALPPDLLGQMLSSLARGAPAGGAATALARRELAVLRLLAAGDSTRDIAGRLSYSERTVKNIVHDVLVKLNCRTRAHAVALATRQGVI